MVVIDNTRSARNVFAHDCFNMGDVIFQSSSLVSANKPQLVGNVFNNGLARFKEFYQRLAQGGAGCAADVVSQWSVIKKNFAESSGNVAKFDRYCMRKPAEFGSAAEFTPSSKRFHFNISGVLVQCFNDLVYYVGVIFGRFVINCRHKIVIYAHYGVGKVHLEATYFVPQEFNFTYILPVAYKTSVQINCTLSFGLCNLARNCAVLLGQQDSRPCCASQGDEGGDKRLVALNPKLQAPLGIAGLDGLRDQLGSASDRFQCRVGNERGKADHYRDPKHDIRRRLLRVRRAGQISRFHPSSVPQATFSGVRMEGGRGRVERGAA